MKKQLTMFAVGAVVLPFVSAGCATKGFVRKELAAQRTAIDSVIAMERTERMAGDSSLRGEFTTQIQQLRADLTSLRDTFNVRITALENGVQFATPVNFAFDDATVRDEDKPLLDRFATVVQKYYPGSKITVEGFADARPVVPGAGKDDPGAEQNRRVVFVIESRPQTTKGVAMTGASQ